MAPSFEIGKPVRSLVRIPGSGQDKSLKPICLDVAQISACVQPLGVIVNFNFDCTSIPIQNGSVNVFPDALPSKSSNTIGSRGGSHRTNDHLNERANGKRGYLLRSVHLTPAERREKMESLKTVSYTH